MKLSNHALTVSKSEINKLVEIFEARSTNFQNIDYFRTLRIEDGNPADKLDFGGKLRQKAFNLEESILLTAPFAHFLSSVLCNKAEIIGDCAYYHSIWQYMNLFELVSNPRWHENFYLKNLGKIIGEKKPLQILISGSADYTLLGYLIEILGEKYKNANITLLEACYTPLYLCGWYAMKMSADIKMILADVFTHRFDQPFDVIITDGFLSQFNFDLKAKVIRKWADELGREGILITTMRIDYSAGDGDENTSFPMESFYELAHKIAQEHKEYLRITTSEFVQATKNFTNSLKTYLPRSEHETRSLFEENGFQIIELERGYENAATARYVRIVAQKI